MRKLFIGFLLSTTVILLNSCDNQPKKEDPGVTVEGKKGGGMEIDKGKMEIEGKKGGELKMDSNGVKIKNKNNN